MGELFEKIRAAIALEQFVVSNHADDRLRERRVVVWQVVAEITAAKLLDERPSDRPNPSVVVDEMLADGTQVRVVWSWDKNDGLARLVTVHFLDR